jgi:hypothetical protein
LTGGEKDRDGEARLLATQWAFAIVACRAT